ncbi:MAG: M10 family metallopeptidase C-terminal domain-containing protein [Pseudomonadota bacterium]
MCILCAPVQPVDTCSTLTSVMDSNTIVETTDAANNTSTTYTIGVGDTFSGFLDAGDTDWVAITLEAGTTYTISLGGSYSNTGTLLDTDLWLYDASGNLIEYDDLDGPSFDAQITYTPTSTGTFFIAAGSYYTTASGTYQLDVAAVQPPAPATVNELADFLTDGYWQSVNFSGFKFDTSNSNVITVDITGLTAAGQQLALWAMEAWEAVANIQFVQVNGNAQITFDDNQSGAFAGPNSVVGGYTTDAIVNVGTGWLNSYGTTIDSYSFQTYVHEIGHALGLGHQGAYNGSATYGTDETFSNDSWQLSIMSYFSQTENSTTNASYAFVMTAMMADIVAIQNLYGASTTTQGNTTWGQGSNFGTYLDDLMAALVSGTPSATVSGNNDVAFTIYDYGGVDTLNLSFDNGGTKLDMRGGNFSNVSGGIGNLGIAIGTVIENAILGSGNDDVTGNNVGNNINAGAGNDTVFALGGWDTIFGGNGNDLLGGGDGNDSISGGIGNDEIYGGAGQDTLIGGEGNDSMGGGGQNDLMNGGNGQDSLGGGFGDDTILGGAGNDSLNGFANRDSIDGGIGDDYLIGGNWGDTVIGGAGNDVIWGDTDTSIPGAYVATGQDVLFGGDGNDTMFGGNGADTMHGENGNDVLWGGNGWNVMYGGNGSDKFFGGNQVDRIYGGAGFDEMTGGGGADIFVFTVGTNTDRIKDFSTAQGDTLELDDALWSAYGNLNKWQVATNFASIGASGFVELNFDGGERIILEGVTSLTGLHTHFDIF